MNTMNTIRTIRFVFMRVRLMRQRHIYVIIVAQIEDVACDKIHSLAVSNLWVKHGIALQNSLQATLTIVVERATGEAQATRTETIPGVGARDITHNRHVCRMGALGEERVVRYAMVTICTFQRGRSTKTFA